jgi:hypothetical protein
LQFAREGLEALTVMHLHDPVLQPQERRHESEHHHAEGERPGEHRATVGDPWCHARRMP